MINKRPKLGLALSGAAARSVFYIGFLEALSENGVQIDYIAANSGSCIVAAAFACGTLFELKEQVFSLNREFLFSIIKRSKDKGGIYSMDKIEQELRKYTKDLKFEDVKPMMGFTCINIDNGEEIVLSMGDIAKAICASCAIPGIFKPVRWGQWNLVDGGLVHTIPGAAARQAGCDMVVGLNLTSRDYVFSSLEVGIKKAVDFFYRLLGFDKAKRAVRGVMDILEKNTYFNNFIDFESSSLERPVPGMFEVLGKAIDLAVAAENSQKNGNNNFDCDIVIRPTLSFVPAWKRVFYLHFADLSGTQTLYDQGRQIAINLIPKIKTLSEEKFPEGESFIL